MDLKDYYIYNRETDVDNDIRNAFVSLNKKLGYFSFSKNARNLIGLSGGDKIMIVQHKKTCQWKLFKTEHQSGYNLNETKKKKGVVYFRLHSRALVHKFFHDYQIDGNTTTLLVKETGDTESGYPVFSLERLEK